MPMRSGDIFSDTPLKLSSAVNPYVGRLRQGGDDLAVRFGSQLKEMAGSWRAFMAARNGVERNRLVVEIGSHKGKVLLAMAEKEPEAYYLGIDITFKRVVMAAERAKDMGLNNVCTVLANAKALELLFAVGEIDDIIIFFPDPWLKKRQAKNRLINRRFVAAVRQVLKPSGRIWFKTDQLSYFEQSREFFEEEGFTNGLSNFSENADMYTSSFEQRFLRAGMPTHQGIWVAPEL